MQTLGLDIGGTRTKGAILDDGRVVWRATSPDYDQPTTEALADSIRSMLAPIAGRQVRVGLCLPGVYDKDAGSLSASVNLPFMVGVRLTDFLSTAAPELAPSGVFTDAHAAALDFAVEHGVKGRLLAVSLGTGVGLSVLDDTVPLRVSAPGLGLSSGHLGQIDVSAAVDGPAPIGRDGGRGSLEAYIGAPALRSRLGDNLHAALPRVKDSDPSVRALVRALRIAHALYRPQVVALLGGVALGIAHLRHDIAALVADGLTNLARPGWQLLVADHEHHAAAGAARLASPDALHRM
ncbi:MAG: ROK family protein [Planctomycetota bacterium]